MIANLEPHIYTQLYNEYKIKESQKATKKWEEFEINITNDVVNKIKAFNPTNR